MPYIPKKIPALQQLLRGKGFSGENLAPIIQCSPNTARKKIRDPALLTVGDLELINRRGHVPIEEIREAIGK